MEGSGLTIWGYEGKMGACVPTYLYKKARCSFLYEREGRVVREQVFFQALSLTADGGDLLKEVHLPRVQLQSSRSVPKTPMQCCDKDFLHLHPEPNDGTDKEAWNNNKGLLM